MRERWTVGDPVRHTVVEIPRPVEARMEANRRLALDISIHIAAVQGGLFGAAWQREAYHKKTKEARLPCSVRGTGAWPCIRSDRAAQGT